MDNTPVNAPNSKRKEMLNLKGLSARPTIGVFLGQLDDRYQSLVWPGIAAAAQKYDLNLAFFPGGPLNIPYEFMAQRNIVYDLASLENIDGLILLSGTLVGYVELETYTRFIAKYHQLPSVSISVHLEGITRDRKSVV